VARVIIADDAAVARRILKNVLSGAGHEIVFEASNGAQAIDAYRRLQPDLVMMDVTMPEVGGLEAARRIIAEFPGARVVMVTAIKSQDMVRKSAEAGVAAYLLKPYSQDRVRELTKNVLAS